MPFNPKARDLATRLGTAHLKPGCTSYWEVPKQRRSAIVEKLNWACFQKLDYPNTRAVRFITTWSPTSKLTPEIAAWWISFLRTFLVDLRWTARVVTIPMNKYEGYYDSIDPANVGPPRTAIYYCLREMSPNAKTSLVYLTLMRYPKEYPLVVKRLYDDRATVGDDPSGDKLFKLFQEIHSAKGRYADFRYFIMDHSAVRPEKVDETKWGVKPDTLSSVVPVPIATFRERVQSKKCPSVWAHFREMNTTTPVVVAAPTPAPVVVVPLPEFDRVSTAPIGVAPRPVPPVDVNAAIEAYF